MIGSFASKAADLGVGETVLVADPAAVVVTPVVDARTFRDVTTPASVCFEKSDSATSGFVGGSSEYA